MQTMLAGLYPPQGQSVWNADIKWQPISIAISDPVIDPFAMLDNDWNVMRLCYFQYLQINNLKCPAAKEAWGPINDENIPEYANILNENRVCEVIATHIFSRFYAIYPV